MTDLVGQYAELALAAETFLSAGRPVPFELSQAIQRIEARAGQVMSPAQIDSALQHVEAAKIRILSVEQVGHSDRMERDADAIAKDTTTGMAGQSDGLTRKQLQAVAEGKSLRVTPPHEVFDPKKANATVRQQTKKFDPAGKGYNLKQWEDKLEGLVSVADDDAKIKRAAQSMGVTEAELRRTLNDWDNTRYDYEMRKRNAVSATPKEEVFKPTDDDQRRAVVTQAYFDSVDGSNEDQMDTLMGDVSSESLEDESMRGDVARAYVQEEETNDAA